MWIIDTLSGYANIKIQAVPKKDQANEGPNQEPANSKFPEEYLDVIKLYSSLEIIINNNEGNMLESIGLFGKSDIVDIMYGYGQYIDDLYYMRYGDYAESCIEFAQTDLGLRFMFDSAGMLSKNAGAIYGVYQDDTVDGVVYLASSFQKLILSLPFIIEALDDAVAHGRMPW